ncbi:hypothetical protein [Streptomyces sp. URMC 129]|uniref:hypothetical protein n=1 Tax=Streptomyces sp. URMC 129 TaxID=3423407 RepID=UPI003F1D2BF5
MEGLPPEDRADVERVLDETLLTARLTSGLDRAGIDRLRALALDSLPEITAAADTEYQRYARLRAASRAGPRQDANGAGTGAMTAVFVLVPVLAAIAAAVFLLLGYALGVAGSEPTIAAPMRQAGWVFAAVAGAGAVAAAVGLVVAAVRNGAAAAPVADETAHAREEWRRALHDRGVVPFLRRHGEHGGRGEHAARRTGFSSPRFSSPHFSSPARDTTTRHRDARR